MLATKILARLLVVHGNGYSKKFSEKNGGYIILQNHLKRWWNIPALWPVCFSILFGQDIALLDLESPFTVSNLLKVFFEDSDTRIVYPEMLPVIAAMLKSGLRSTILSSDAEDQDFVNMQPSSSGLKLSSIHFYGECSKGRSDARKYFIAHTS